MSTNDTTSPTTTIQLWICGHNMTGYLPESDTPVFTSWSGAKDYLMGEMTWSIDNIGTGDPDPWGETYAESLVNAREDLNLSSGPDWGDVLDAGEHAAMSWWINVETFTDRDAAYQYVSDLASLDDDQVNNIMSDVDAEMWSRIDDQPDADLTPDAARRRDAGRFFREHAGYNVLPHETDDAAKARCSTALVKAEWWARDAGVTFVWSPDDHNDYDGTTPDQCEHCIAYGADGTVLASLGCIDDATPEYRRVVEAELASEAMGPVVTRLVSGDDQVNDSVRALLFGVLADLSAPTVSHYRSDWYHDARWIREHVLSAPFTFLYSWSTHGTHIGTDSMLEFSRTSAVRVTLLADDVDGAPWVPGRPTTFRASVERLK